ncbi:hypothetical protein J2T60_001625 [Natronospira proteinivora]|uniref:GIY-YIG domain-containing protein n=1 Tax=Natronospira proteinivora TaxID=1807133 RepID=A0ABT1G8J3_9GAMM|nr:hypothetical protein [Natronospira proteinivora]MCP1727625.1 hypothetical protein [Natronospira proteinivora]
MQSPFPRGKPRVWRKDFSYSTLPQQWAMYRFVAPGNGIDYIGITNNLYRRAANHRSKPKVYLPDIHEIHYQIPREGVHYDELRAWEIHKIAQHEPRLVGNMGGGGKTPTIVIYGEEVAIEDGESAEDAAERVGLFQEFLDIFRSRFGSSG